MVIIQRYFDQIFDIIERYRQMCGILAYFRDPSSSTEVNDEFQEYDEQHLSSLNQSLCFESSTELFNKLIPYIVRRGPNYASFRALSDVNATFFSSILSLRTPFTKQSVLVNDRYVLQYNGELYNDQTLDYEGSDNDTAFIMSLLSLLPVEDVIKKCYGEFAYTITDLVEKKVYFGRDSVGKRSLSYRIDGKDIYITSTSGKCADFSDCLAGVIYIYDLKTRSLDVSKSINDHPFKVSDQVDEGLRNLEYYKSELYNKLNQAVYQRVVSIHPLHLENNNISVLFSGGLDCSVVTAILCEQLIKTRRNTNTVIELLNVGFENPRTGKMPADSPDRILALKSTELLKRLYPGCNIKLIEVDVPYEEYLSKRETVVDLIYPKNTEMDLSIAIAFYFASRGRGNVMEGSNRIKYNRTGIVLFSGLGADELYGGYHKLANKSEEELTVELQRQIEGIHDRNLNRDDKVISDHGVEVRYPFLDEEVIRFSVSLPLNYKINKNILRVMARDLLGLEFISDEPKRAIQFGARSAKMTKDSNKKGTDLLKIPTQ